MNPEIKLENCCRSLAALTVFKPQIVLVLGSGLGGFTERMKIEQTIEYGSVEGFPVSTVSGHSGRLVLGYVGGVATAAMQGRVHYYEGNDITDVVLPIRVLRRLGAEKLVLTNAAGGINEGFRRGDFMLITDHISSLIPSPLRGANIDSLGVRFPDMSSVYDKKLCSAIRKAATKNRILLREGVYLQAPGPQFETPAEIKMYRSWGADAVGMSTACEAIAAVHAGYRVCGVSLISNAAAGMTDQPLSHEEVKESANRVSSDFSRLIESAITEMGNEG